MNRDIRIGSVTGGLRDAAAPPLIVTAWSSEQTRRWPVLLASVGLRVARPEDVLRREDMPALHVHIDSHDVWLTKVVPTAGRCEWEQSMEDWWQKVHRWLDCNGRNDSSTVERFNGYAEVLSGLFEFGWEPLRGNDILTWVEFPDHSGRPDWRMVADTIAAVVNV